MPDVETPAVATPAVATRVVLLARPGAACERLSAALQEAGAELVLVADPTVIDQDSVAGAAPQAILVALEPSVEDALDRFGRVLSDPGITVLFDEAELAAQRAGWDAARWVRHLSAKLHRHGDVLPPGGEDDADWYPSPGPLRNVVTPASELDFSAFAGEAEQLAGDLPRDTVLEGLQPGAASATPGIAAARSDDEPRQRVAEAPGSGAGELSLADTDSYGHGPRRGVVLVEAGLGGPDAVRQLLGEMPAGFPRPILVRLRLDGGRYDRLVKQMGRATQLPVALAEAGQSIERGHVYFMPPDITVVDDRTHLKFDLGDGVATSLFAALPAQDSAVLFLSGSAPEVVEAAMRPSWSGALVAAQSPESCYDGAASTDVIARGGSSGSPAELAERLSARWPI